MAARLLAIACAVVIVVYSEGNHQYCGAKLNNIMRFVCNGSYNIKRSSYYPNADNPVEIGDDGNNMVLSYLMDRRLATSMLKNREFRHPLQKRDGGIVEECCHKSCSLKELQSYCEK